MVPVSLKRGGGEGSSFGVFFGVIYNFLFLSNTREEAGLGLDFKKKGHKQRMPKNIQVPFLV